MSWVRQRLLRTKGRIFTVVCLTMYPVSSAAPGVFAFSAVALPWFEGRREPDRETPGRTAIPISDMWR